MTLQFHQEYRAVPVMLQWKLILRSNWSVLHLEFLLHRLRGLDTRTLDSKVVRTFAPFMLGGNLLV